MTAAVEGANYATGGEYYVASLQKLAQAEGGTLPPPPPSSGGEVFGPPPGGSQSGGGSFGQPPAGGGFQPPSGPGGPIFGSPPGGQQQEQFGPPPQGQFGGPNQQQFGGPGGQQGQQQFPGQGQGAQGQFPGQGQPFGGEQGQQSEFFGEGGSGEEFDSGVYVSPQEIQQTKRELKDLNSQLKQLGKTRGITPDLRSNVQELASEVSGFSSIIGNASASDEELRDAIDEFHQRNFWDDINALRARVQLPNELKQLSKTVARLEKALKTKTAAAVFDAGRVSQFVSEWKQQLSQVQAALGGGQYEEAQELMQVFYENHPGECEGTIFQILDFVKNIKRIKDRNIKSQADTLLQPIIALVNGGECRTAREEFEDIRGQITQFLRSGQQRTQRTRTTQ